MSIISLWKIRGTGYPFGLTQNELGFEEKNLSGLDFIKP